MQLLINVIEACGLQALDPEQLCSPHVKLRLGRHKLKTQVIKKTLNPKWDEEFNFWVGDLQPKEKLIVSVMDVNNGKFLGELEIPLSKVLETDNLSLGTSWYELKPKRKPSKNRVRGEICLSISLLHGNSSQTIASCSSTSADELTLNLDKSSERMEGTFSSFSTISEQSSTFSDVEGNKPDNEEKPTPAVGHVHQILIGTRPSPATIDDIETSKELIDNTLANTKSCEKQSNSECSNVSFDELVKVMESKGQGGEMPKNLPGGVLVDKCYAISPGQMNSLLFSPTSEFCQKLPELQGTTDVQIEAWGHEVKGENLRRVITYVKAATKMVKAMKATDEQIYLKADGKSYAVLASVSTPDAPFGSYFKTEILYCMTPGPELPSEDPSCHLIISWRMNFLQSTMMKSMIENGAKQGLTESFTLITDKLSQYAKPVDLESTGSNKEQILASLQTEEESPWKLSFQTFGDVSFVFFTIIVLYILIHIIVAKTSPGLEFFGLDLPDSFGEIVVCGLLIFQGQHVWNKIGRFFHARKQGGKDHGVKAQGDGWVLTVALIEGSNIPTRGQSASSSPYVVFTCNGKTKTSSIKFQTANPQWNEVFEFDATCDPPSRMEVTVYDFDGPFDEAIPLGYSEVNFVKSNLSDLANVWVPLQGKCIQASKCELHLRIFLDNTRGNEVVIEYLTKMGREVGKKINLRSPQQNAAFQKLFELPPEEFLISDYTCYLKRKMPLQGRLFLSPRIIGFHANLFGHRTKFFFLWEDIKDIQHIAPSFASGCSPSLMIILCKGRGEEARHGAKSVDRKGRLKFRFQTFVYFNGAYRTIKALWKARLLSPEQKMQIVEESDIGSLQNEESGSSLGAENANMSEIFSLSLPVSAKSLMEIFEGGSLEHKLMKSIGFLDYSPAPWQAIEAHVYQRQVSYRLDKSVIGYKGEVNSTQQRSCSANGNKWVLEDTVKLDFS
ncbi:uncharacterized protein A4U43_C01F35170 [Asparagus officinalis]|uniref:C2 and GRAM domain-containing protein n=1 Tax=Asparagus officinalis TaxID=4686 RepID=A0A5P1FWI3_ASPOF|nr:uncharacterized protein A4U43_C01F35170 [Asparagus officinalis]